MSLLAASLTILASNFLFLFPSFQFTWLEFISYASLVVVHAALKWFHSFKPDDVQNRLDSSICLIFFEAAKCSKSSPIVKKLPISPEIIRKIVSKFASPNANLRDLRLACLCALGFAGFLRYNELSSILLLHLEFHTDLVRIFVPQAKNDAYREGNYVYVKRLNSQFCPVALLERYILQADIDLNSTLPLFRPLRYCKSTNRYKLYGNNKLSYTCSREIFKRTRQGKFRQAT